MPFCILFDSGATHSFISTQFTLQLDLEHIKVKTNYTLRLPNDSIVDYPILYKHVTISISEFIFLGDLIQFDLLNFDILGLNWLHSYEVKIYFRKVILCDEKGQEICLYRERDEKPCHIISAMKASKLLCQSCNGYWCYAMDI